MEETVFPFSEIFTSLQGEGRNTGRPAVFLRLAGCNISCPWCDTDRRERFRLALDEAADQAEASGAGSAIITGGEPTIHPGLCALARELRRRGIWVALETNGIVAPEDPSAFDFIAVSPKASFASMYRRDTMLRKAGEVRIVAENDRCLPFFADMRNLIEAQDYYVSPLDPGGGRPPATGLALRMMSALNAGLPRGARPWALSVQTHKILGMR